MIYVTSGAFVKFIKREAESEALRSWRGQISSGTELATSELADLEITRTLLRAGGIPSGCPTCPGRRSAPLPPRPQQRGPGPAKGYRLRELGSLDAVHLATAEPFRAELTDFVTYDSELAAAATELGLPVRSPS